MRAGHVGVGIVPDDHGVARRDSRRLEDGNEHRRRRLADDLSGHARRRRQGCHDRARTGQEPRGRRVARIGVRCDQAGAGGYRSHRARQPRIVDGRIEPDDDRVDGPLERPARFTGEGRCRHRHVEAGLAQLGLHAIGADGEDRAHLRRVPVQVLDGRRGRGEDLVGRGVDPHRREAIDVGVAGRRGVVRREAHGHAAGMKEVDQVGRAGHGRVAAVDDAVEVEDDQSHPVRQAAHGAG